MQILRHEINTYMAKHRAALPHADTKNASRHDSPIALNEFKFSPPQRRIYKALKSIGQATARDIAKRSKYPCNGVLYKRLGQLLDIGAIKIVSQTPYRNTTKTVYEVL